MGIKVYSGDEAKEKLAEIRGGRAEPKAEWLGVIDAYRTELGAAAERYENASAANRLANDAREAAEDRAAEARRFTADYYADPKNYVGGRLVVTKATRVALEDLGKEQEALTKLAGDYAKEAATRTDDVRAHAMLGTPGRVSLEGEHLARRLTHADGHQSLEVYLPENTKVHFTKTGGMARDERGFLVPTYAITLQSLDKDSRGVAAYESSTLRGAFTRSQIEQSITFHTPDSGRYAFASPDTRDDRMQVSVRGNAAVAPDYNTAIYRNDSPQALVKNVPRPQERVKREHPWMAESRRLQRDLSDDGRIRAHERHQEHLDNEQEYKDRRDFGRHGTITVNGQSSSVVYRRSTSSVGVYGGGNYEPGGLSPSGGPHSRGGSTGTWRG